MSTRSVAPSGSITDDCNGQYVLEVRTMQSGAFKVLQEGLKELLTECSIDFDESGMKIVTMDNTHIVLVHLKLDASKFEYYHIDNKIKIGINMLHFHKLIRTINSNDTLTLYIEKNDINHLGIRIENGEKHSKTHFKLDLLDLDNKNIKVDNADFNNTITLPSVDFQKICRDMHQLSEIIEIKNFGNQLILSCKGDFCYQETILTDNDNGDAIEIKPTDTNNNEIVQGVFNLKCLCQFTKCTNLCSSVEIFLKNDYPLIVRYQVASLGEIKLCLDD